MVKQGLAVATACLMIGTAHADVPEAVQEIGMQAAPGPYNAKTCAYWSNAAATAVRSRDRGIPEQKAENAVPLPGKHPTDDDTDLHARRVEVIAQVYEAAELQHASPKQLHDAVFKYCQSLNN